MTGAERLILNIHDPKLIEPLAEFRQTVQEMFAGREGANCREYTSGTLLDNVPTLHAESPVGGTWRAPFILHGARVSAAIVDEEFELTQAHDELVSVQAYFENIVGPRRNEGEMRHRDFQLQYSRQDKLGNIALWRMHKQTFKSEHSNGLGLAESESTQQVREPLTNSAEIHQYLRGAAHLISVFLDPEKHPKTQLLR
jgi:hypothetical protein